MVGSDGRVFEKTFIPEHVTRDSVRDLLHDGFGVDDLEGEHSEIVRSPNLMARAFFSSHTVRPRQLTVLTVEISLAEGIHVYGRPLSSDYVPVELALSEGGHLVLDRVEYPEPEEMELAALGERLPVYTGRFTIKAHCMGTGKPDGQPPVVKALLSYQACDDSQCYLPQTDEFELPLEYIPHVG